MIDSSIDHARSATPLPHDLGTKSRQRSQLIQYPLHILAVLVRFAAPIGILAVGWVVYSILAVEIEQEKGPEAEKQIIRTKVTEPSVRDYPVVIETNAVVQAHNPVTINAQVSGKVTRISPSFEAGAYFAEGEVLVELEERDFTTAQKMAQAQHRAATSALSLAQLNEKRKLRLEQENAVSKAEVETAAAAREQAAADLEAAAAQLQRAETDLERTKIKAPFDGRVRIKSVGLGQSVGPSVPLGDVFAVNFAEVRLPISGEQMQFLNLPIFADDPPVEVDLRDAINKSSKTVWKAKIVRTEGVLDENTREVFAVARIDDPFGRKSRHSPLRIGQPVVASITGEVLKDVVALPRQAVRQMDQIVLVDKDDNTITPKTIDAVWSNKEHVIVRRADIDEGQWIATTHLVYAPQGTKVEIIPDIDPDADVNSAVAKSDTNSEQESVAN